MTIHTLYIFDRHCHCLFFHDWQNEMSSLTHPLPSDFDLASVDATKGSRSMPWQDEAKLVFGVILSLRNISKRLSLKSGSEGFTSYRTNNYRLHYYESPSLLKFVLTTDPKVENMRHVLRTIYLNIYVEYIVKNPLVARDAMFHNDAFQRELHRFIRALPVYGT